MIQRITDRRGFFAGTASIIAAVAMAARTHRLPRPPAVSKPNENKGSGYRLTSHVRHYYRTTRL